MNFKQNEMVVYRRLVANVQAGFLALNNEIQNEIKRFVEDQQHENGAFIDRAGKPDFYYSLFGLWLCMALEQPEQSFKLKAFVSMQNSIEPSSIVEELALSLIKGELDAAQKKKSVFSIVQRIVSKGKTIDISYQFFLAALVIDAQGKKSSLFNFFARFGLLFYKPKENSSCSIISALLYARKIFHLNTQKLQEELMQFQVESGGFRGFEKVNNADTLSTGVALFVLNETACDLRLILPKCLNFIQQNYSGGAFLSGDGDETKDLEYTFYGLLALGGMVTKMENE